MYVSLHKLPNSLRNKLKIYFSSVGSPCIIPFCNAHRNLSKDKELQNMVIWYFPEKILKIIFIQKSYSSFDIFGTNFWLWALTFLCLHLNIFDFMISILKAIFWFAVMVFGKISLLIHFIPAFLASIFFQQFTYILTKFNFLYWSHKFHKDHGLTCLSIW